MIKVNSMRWVGSVTCIDYNKNTYRLLDGMTGKNELPGRQWSSWEGHIKTDLKDV
jgi:hypothetical protein